MKYYVISDVHGFYSQMRQALQDKGFFDDTEPHKLIVCGDLLDRGKEAIKTQNFMVDLLYKDQLILIRGNHEDLMLDMLDNFENYRGCLIMIPTEQDALTNGRMSFIYEYG